MTRYRNPWFNPRDRHYGPAFYETDATPSECNGFLIYERVKGHVFDVVKDGACVTQMAGPNGARSWCMANGNPTGARP
jgi:hypothetical protein